jgi:hypothetical protein
VADGCRGDKQVFRSPREIEMPRGNFKRAQATQTEGRWISGVLVVQVFLNDALRISINIVAEFNIASNIT